jgi:hypothetical protein
MANDYTVKIKAQNLAGKAVREAKAELESLGKEGDKMSRLRTYFESITESSKPLKTQMRQLKELLANMNLEGLDKTDLFVQISQRAGEIKDAIGDASDAMTRFSSDTLNLDVATQGFTAVTGAASIATSAFALFGGESEDVQRAILKVQAAMGILNGAQAVANALNKNGAIVMGLRKAWLDITSAATTKNTIATAANTLASGVNTAATGINTVAVTESTVAQTAWNTAKAVGSALLGNWGALALVAAGAVATYAVATSNSSDAINDENSAIDENISGKKSNKKATDEAAEAEKRYKEQAQSTFAQLMTDYTQLQMQWGKLKTAHEKNSFIRDNQSKFESLGLAIDGVSSAERVFAQNTDAVVQSFIRRAKAAAALSKLTELYKKQMDLIDQRNTIVSSIAADAASRPRVTAGQEITDQNEWSARYGNAKSGKWLYTEEGARLHNGNVTSSSNNPQLNRNTQALNENTRQINQQAKLIDTLVKDTPSIATAGAGQTVTTRTASSGASTSTSESYAKGSVGYYEQEVKRLEGLQKRATDVRAIKSYEAQIVELKKKIAELDPEYLMWMESMSKIKTMQIDTSAQAVSVSVPDMSDILKQSRDMVRSIDLSKQMTEAIGMYKAGKITRDEAQQVVDRINGELGKIGNGVKVNIDLSSLQTDAEKLADTLDRTASAFGSYDFSKQIAMLKQLKKVFESDASVAVKAGSAISYAGSTLQAIGRDSAAAKAGLVLSAIGQIILGFATATAKDTKLGVFGWIAAITAGTAVMISTINQLQSFSQGGIVSGGSTHGDQMLARVNSREMILNGTQQKRLFDMIDRGGYRSGSPVVLDTRIKGTDIYLTQKNLNSKMSKIR